MDSKRKREGRDATAHHHLMVVENSHGRSLSTDGTSGTEGDARTERNGDDHDGASPDKNVRFPIGGGAKREDLMEPVSGTEMRPVRQGVYIDLPTAPLRVNGITSAWGIDYGNLSAAAVVRSAESGNQRVVSNRERNGRELH